MSNIPTPPTAPLPWENRRQIGLADAILETVKLFFLSPREAWNRTSERGEIGEALLFGVLVSWIGSAASTIYHAMLPRPWVQFIPADVLRRFPGLAGAGAGRAACSILFAPVGAVIGLFLAALVVHVCLLIVGGVASSASGFEGTFRVLAYSSVASLANVVPFVGGLIAFFWGFALVVLGFVRIHKTTTGRAVAALLIPLVLIAALVALAIMALLFFVFDRTTHG
jgi:hypothetical protein